MTHLLRDEKLENPSNYDNHDHQQCGQVSNMTKSVGKERRKSIPKLEAARLFLEKQRGNIMEKERKYEKRLNKNSNSLKNNFFIV
jgi:hypothetical protein